MAASRIVTRPAVVAAGVLNRTLLARQLLLQRRRLSTASALERVAGLQTQYAPTAYIGLWSRVADFRRDALTGGLQRKIVVQGTLMRATIHTVSSRDYPQLADGIREARRQWWARAGQERGRGVDFPSMAELADRLLADGPLKRAELVSALEQHGYPPAAFEGLGMWLDLVRVPPSGTWERRRADLYQTAPRWLGCRPGDAAAGLRHVVTRYLGGFGPAAVRDIASWAGTPVGILSAAVEELPLRRLRGEDDRDLVDLPRRPLVPADHPAPVRFLGPWEALLLAHARPSGVLPEEYRPAIFTSKNPHSVGTFLVDGAVAGIWRQEGKAVVVKPFAPLPRQARREVDEQRRELAAFMR